MLRSYASRRALATFTSLAAALGIAAPSAAAATFDFSGDFATYTVPDGVTSLKVTLIGGAGGDGAADGPGVTPNTSGGQGGAGGRTTARIAVTPGETLRLFVGGGGGDAFTVTAGGHGAGGPFTGGAGGFGGLADAGGGGGGASSILRGDSPLVVAGGGGGGGGEGVNPPLAKDYITGAYGGAGGSPAAGGERPNGRMIGDSGAGGANTLWTGGNGGMGLLTVGAGGGGGGGRMGGTGGDAGQFVVTLGFFGAQGGGGGGGGSSWTEPTALHVSHGVAGRSASERNGRIEITPVAGTTTSIVQDAGRSSSANPATFTATVAGGDGSGTVDFEVRSFPNYRPSFTFTPCRNVPLQNVGGAWRATCSSAGLDVGGHFVKARYSGSVDRTPSTSGEVNHEVGSATTARFINPPATATSSESVTFKVAVDGSGGIGTVTWPVAPSPACPGYLAFEGGSWVSTCTMPMTFFVGNRTITARYEGRFTNAPYIAPSTANHVITVAESPERMTVALAKSSPLVGEAVQASVRYLGSNGQARSMSDDNWKLVRVTLENGGECTQTRSSTPHVPPFGMSTTGVATCTPRRPGPGAVTAEWTFGVCLGRSLVDNNPNQLVCSGWTGFEIGSENGHLLYGGDCNGEWVGAPRRYATDCKGPAYYPTGSATLDAIGPPTRIEIRSLNDHPQVGEPFTLAAAGFDAVGHATGDVDPAKLRYSIGAEPCFGAVCIAPDSTVFTVTGVATGLPGEPQDDAELSIGFGVGRHMVLDVPAHITTAAAQPYNATLHMPFAEEFVVLPFDYRVDGVPVPGCTNVSYFANGGIRQYPCSFRIPTPGRHAVSAVYEGGNQGSFFLSGRTVRTRIVTVYGPQTALDVSGPEQLAAGSGGTFDVRRLDTLAQDVGADTDAALSIAPVTGGSADGASCSGRSCSATRAGTYRVRAQNGSMTDTTTVEVVPAAASRIEASPEAARIPTGGSALFRLTALDAYGNSRGEVTDEPGVQAAFTDGQGTCEVTRCASSAVGTHTIVLSYPSGAGTLATTTQLEVFVPDLTPPVVSLDAVTARSTDATPTFAGEAGRASGDKATVTVRVYAGNDTSGNVVQTLTATRDGGTGRFSVDATALPDGTYTAQASQLDESNNTGTSAARTFTVDTAAPALTLNAPGSVTTDSTPAIGGGAGAMAGDATTVTIRLYRGSGTTGPLEQTLTATRNGSAFSVDPALLADGSYTAVATQSDDLGHVATTAARTFLVDAAAPTPTLDAIPARVGTTRPRLSGHVSTGPLDHIHGPPYPYVTFWRGTEIVQGGAAGSHILFPDLGSGWFSELTFTPLTEGTYITRLQQSDSLGRIGYSATQIFTVDTTAPVVALDAVPSPAADRTPALAGTADRLVGDAGTVTIKVHRGTDATGPLLQTLTPARDATTGRFGVDAAALGDGTYTAFVSQSDDVGNATTSAGRTFVVDGEPSVVLDAPAARTADTTPSLTGEAALGTGDSATVRVAIYSGGAADGTPVQTVTATRDATTGRFAVEAGQLADGAYTAQATQADDGGNTGRSDAHTFAVDATAPSVTLDAVDAAGGDLTPTFTGAGGLLPGDTATVTVRVYSGSSAVGTPLQTLTATRDGATGRYAVDAAALGAGTFTAQATQVDDLGNAGTSAARTFTTDTTAPVVALDAPPSRIADSTPALAGEAGRVTGDSATVTVRIETTGGAFVQTRTATRDATTGRFSVDAAALADGAYTARATQLDEAGNTGTSDARSFTVDTTGPALVLDAPPARTADTTPALTGTRGAATGDVATVTIRILEGIDVVQTLTTTAASFSVEPDALADGSYLAVATQADDLGTATTSTVRSFTVDTAAPVVTLDSPGARTGDDTPALAGAGSRAPGDAGTVTVRVYAGSGTGGDPLQWRTAAVGTDGAFAVAAETLADGRYTAVAQQADDLGHTGSSSPRTFVVDTAAPKPSLAAVAARTADPTPALAGSGGRADGDGSSVTLRIRSGAGVDGAVVQTLTATVGTDGAFAIDAERLGDGTYTAVAEQSDDVGNADTSEARTFTVDTTGPGVALRALSARTGDPTPAFSGAAGLAEGDSDKVTVRVHEGADTDGDVVQTHTVTLGPAGSFSGETGDLADGTYTAQASQADDLGNSRASTARTFVVDTTAPIVTLDPLAARTGDDTPAFAGRGGRQVGDGDGVTVRIHEGTSTAGDVVQTRTRTIGSDGAFSVDAERLADGTYTAQAAQADDVGNADVSVARTFVVDTAAPTVTLDALAARTGDDTPAFAGTGTRAAGDADRVTVRVYEGSDAEGDLVQTRTATVGDGGTFATAAEDLADGTYTAQATQADDLGHAASSVARTFTVDTTKPVVTLDTMAARTGDATPALAGSAGRAAGDAVTVTVRVYGGSSATGEPVQTRTATRDGSTGAYAVAAEALADGTYTAQATQGDDVGNSDVSTARTFVVDTAAPAVTLDAIASRTGDDTPALSGSAGRATGDAGTVTVRVLRGEDVVQTRTATVGSGGAFSVDATTLADGTYTAEATQSDDVGNADTSGARSFTVDTAAPVVGLDAIGPRTGDSTPALAGSGGRADGDANTVTVRVYDGSDADGDALQTRTATVGSGGAYAVDATQLADGTYTAQASQADDLGHVATTVTRTFTVDTAAPAVALDALAARTADPTPGFAGDGGLATGDAQTVTVRVYSGDDATGDAVQTRAATRAATGGRFAVDAEQLADGTYTAQAAQADDVGNGAVSTARTFTVDTGKPTVTLDALAARTGDATPALSGSGSRALGDEDTVTVRVFRGSGTDGEPEQTRTATRDGSTGAYSVDATTLADGTYTAQATQADDVGNAEVSTARTFTVDTIAPTVTLTAIAARTADATPALAGTGSRALGDAETVTVRVYRGTDTDGELEQTRTATRDGSTGAYSADAETLADGTYTAQATQADDVGNAGTSAAQTFVVDTAAPAVTLDALAARTGDSTPALAGSGGAAAGDSSTVTMRVYGGTDASGEALQTRTATRDGTTGRYAVDASGLPDGVYTAQASQADDLGHADTSEARTFTVDTAKPTVTLEAVAPRTGDATPAFAGSGGRADGDADTVTVRVYRGADTDGELEQTRTTSLDGTTGAYAVDAETLADGTYTAQATQADDVGNADTSAARTFTVDTAAPAVSLDAIGPRTGDDTPALTGSAGDADDDAETVTVRVFAGEDTDGEALQARTAAVSSGGTYAVDAAQLADGTYTAQATQTDDLDHAAASTARTFTVDTDAPSVTLDTPAATTDDATPTFTGSASRAVGDAAEVAVRVLRGGDLVQTRTATRDAATGRYSVDAAALPAGAYTVRAVQADDVGHSADSETRSFTIDTSQPGSATSRSAAELTNLRVAVAADGTATVTGTVSGPGTIDVLETIHRMGAVGRASALRPGPNAVMLGRERLVVSAAGAVRLRVGTTGRGQSTLAARRARGHQVSVNAYVTFTDASGRAATHRKRVRVAQEKGLVARVLRVVDGDTLRVRAGGRRMTVHLLGVAPACEGGKPAAALARLAGRTVRIVADPRHRATRTARQMRAYVLSGRLDLGSELVRTGMAGVDDGVRFARGAEYARLAAEARQARRGCATG